jgi:flavin reductase (DIM6/NTAB) family NADH-FMN oxidoreductase RutF
VEPISSLDLSDEDFIARFESAGFGRSDFPHAAHLRMAWIYVRHLGVEQAAHRAAAGIRAMADAHGQSNRYHDTLTRAWVYVVGAAVTRSIDTGDFNEFILRQTELLDKSCLLRYFSPERLSSQRARTSWLAPDLQPIPGAPTSSSAPSEPDATPVPPVPADEFRHTLRHLPSPVAVMTARDATRLHATTVTSVASIESDPATLVICVQRGSRILDIARAAGGFAVSYLANHQGSIATHFADPARGDGAAQFRGIPHVVGRFGAPIITGGPVWFECQLGNEFAAAGHQIVCGKVVAEGTTGTQPLQQLRGGWL